MPQTLPPYALPSPSFRFRHLAAFAGKAPIGGAREVALAALVAARLAVDSVESMGEETDARAARATAAKAWMAALALPPAVRAALSRCTDASSGAPPQVMASELSALSKIVASYLDPVACSELDSAAAALTA